MSLLSPNPVRHIFPVPSVGSEKMGNKVLLQINQGSNNQPLLQLLPADESLETGNPVLYLQCALVIWHGRGLFMDTLFFSEWCRKDGAPQLEIFSLLALGNASLCP